MYTSIPKVLARKNLGALIEDLTLGDIQGAVIAASHLKNPGTSFEKHCHFLLRKLEPLDKVAKTPSKAGCLVCAGLNQF